MGNVYVEISKELGFERRDVEIPQFSDILTLIDRARGGDIEAFKKIFEVYRFAESPSEPDKQEAMAALVEGWEELSPKFRELERPNIPDSEKAPSVDPSRSSEQSK